MKLINLMVVAVFSLINVQHGFCVTVDFMDNVPLTGRRIQLDRLFPVIDPGEPILPHPAIPLSDYVQCNSLVFVGDPLYSTVQISDIFRHETVDDPSLRSEQSFGTGFLAIDRSKPFNGIYRPSNLSVSQELIVAGTFPRTLLVTNKHVLNSELETDTENKYGSTWVKGFYKFVFHLVKAQDLVDDRGMPYQIGEFKTASVTVPLANLVIHHLPDDVLIQPGRQAAIDLAAIDVDPIFRAISGHIAGDPTLTGFKPFYSAFDTIESFKHIPPTRTLVETFGYPLAVVGGGMLPVYGRGLVSGDIETIVRAGPEDKVVDGYFDLDIASGTSGSPVYYADGLAGVAFASSNEYTHRLGCIISARRVKTLIGLIP